MAEVIMELEEEEHIKVKEHVDVDAYQDYEIGLDIGLNVEAINDRVIEKFISDYNSNSVRLDDTLFTFQTHDQMA